MNKKALAFNESNLAILGLYETVYDLYSCLLNIYDSAIEKLDTSRIGFHFLADDMCRKQVRQKLDDFIFNNSHLFSENSERFHVNKYGFGGFSVLECKHSGLLKVTVQCITFHSFVEELFYIVVRTIAQRRSRNNPLNATSNVAEKVNQHIQSLVSQYRNRIPVTSTLNVTNENSQLFVYSQFSLISCNQKKHTIVSDVFRAEKLDGSGFYNLPIHHCVTCGRKFVGKHTLDFFQKEFGKIYVTVQTEQSSNRSTAFDALKPESELHSRGYNVQEGQLSENERRNLLIRLMQTGEMSYFEICRDIKNAIQTQQHLPLRPPAVAKWKSDLEFLSKYVELHSELR